MNKDIEQSLLKNLILKTKITIGFFVLVLVLQSMGFYVLTQHVGTGNINFSHIAIIPLFILFIIVDELGILWHLNKTAHKQSRVKMIWIYIISCMEISYPTLLLIYGSSIMESTVENMTAFMFTSSPPFLLYYIFIILSSLTFNFRLCVVVSLMGTLQFLGVTFFLFDPEINFIEFAISILKGLFLFPTGIIAAFVARTIKESILDSLKAKNILINELDSKVKERTVEIEKQKTEILQQHQLLEVQKEHLEITNKEITDSISYARRIQEAILPPDNLITKALCNSFILYQPKDIVAGDFYWMEEKNNSIFFAVADCTGHGVPGAMVSVVCVNAMNRAIREFGIRDTSLILDKTRKLVIETFERGTHDVKDGMDISLFRLQFKNPESGTLESSETVERNNPGKIKVAELQWSGANNPLWIIRNNELVETKADKQPIGKSPDPKPFTAHIIELYEGDCVYTFTDGFQDQFGGYKGKKFKASQLKLLLLDNQHLSMEDQKDLLTNSFSGWKGIQEQVDDVCFFGMRI